MNMINYREMFESERAELNPIAILISPLLSLDF